MPAGRCHVSCFLPIGERGGGAYSHETYDNAMLEPIKFVRSHRKRGTEKNVMFIRKKEKVTVSKVRTYDTIRTDGQKLMNE